MLTLLITRQRTGSGALGSILHRHPELFYAGEVLHPDDAVNPHNFFTFLKGDAAREKAFSHPNTRRDLVKSYFRHVESATQPRGLVLDLKYRSLHHFNLGWQGLFERPWIIAHARQANIPILHLRRRNYVATYVSGRLAEANRVWHTNDPSKLRTASLSVVPKDLRNFLNECVREASLLNDWLNNQERVLTLEYETLLGQDGQIPEASAAEIAAFLGIGPFVARGSAFIKQAPAKLSDSIENFGEVAAALRTTEFSWMMHAP